MRKFVISCKLNAIDNADVITYSPTSLKNGSDTISFESCMKACYKLESKSYGIEFFNFSLESSLSPPKKHILKRLC